jgi:hypothetical protein
MTKDTTSRSVKTSKRSGKIKSNKVTNNLNELFRNECFVDDCKLVSGYLLENIEFVKKAIRKNETEFQKFCILYGNDLESLDDVESLDFPKLLSKFKPVGTQFLQNKEQTKEDAVKYLMQKYNYEKENVFENFKTFLETFDPERSVNLGERGIVIVNNALGAHSTDEEYTAITESYPIEIRVSADASVEEIKQYLSKNLQSVQERYKTEKLKGDSSSLWKVRDLIYNHKDLPTMDIKKILKQELGISLGYDRINSLKNKEIKNRGKRPVINKLFVIDEK